MLTVRYQQRAKLHRAWLNGEVVGKEGLRGVPRRPAARVLYRVVQLFLEKIV